MRFTDTPNRFIAMNANSSDRGITDAVMSAARTFRRNRKRITTTSSRLGEVAHHGPGGVIDHVTLAVIRRTLTPSGTIVRAASRSSTCRITSRPFDPLSMMTLADTASPRPSRDTAP
jgi:hypothetical protein